jgi:hypothetical protein
MTHPIEKLLTRATTLLQTSSQLEVYTQSYGPPKSRESQLGISGLPLGNPRKNAIWMLVLWLVTKYTIRGKVVASPKSRLW